ncbi:hypothetical protein [Limosilactobacillus reuteri]|uniref:hypothetical protein n=1 Tax=Limosilactobacillus reuteri TaxID=1598 RepID=UPI0011801EFD|nr:hypothetical protein [Limosilactobacillus reuteri]MCT3212414.1 hypothetical protein [Limosilactobacillus reuteri]TSB20819.1 hypothetical protein FOG82_01450 [Limosilactobacillus reuteri]UAW61550.1 hypothetical protein K3F52_05090 [Limosilactobacillus reuteri]
MSEFKLPHVEGLATNSKLPGQLTENFKAIEQELTNLRENNAKLKKLQTALGLSDDDLNSL